MNMCDSDVIDDEEVFRLHCCLRNGDCNGIWTNLTFYNRAKKYTRAGAGLELSTGVIYSRNARTRNTIRTGMDP